MDASASEWSSGCESGWTVYLDESSQSTNQHQRGSRRGGCDHNHKGFRANYEEEEDLSMVSDASSGPPHFRYEEEEEGEEVECFRKAGFECPPCVEKAKKKSPKEPRGKHHQHSYLDDTASSPALNCPKYMDPSKNQPATGHGVGQGGFGFWSSSYPKRQDPAEPSLFRGRRRG